MPKAKETSNHPCHFLSLPSAKRFWCRHCMSVFEDAITRWRHSRSCRYGVVNNFMRRRQLEAKALQNTTKPNPIEARLEQSVSPSVEPIVGVAPGPSSSSSEAPSTSIMKTNVATSDDLFRCFICHNKFSTLEEMRHHVKYPCNNKKIITDVPNPAVTVYIDEFTDRSRQWDPQPQTEEVVTSEFVPNIVSQETVQSTVDVKTIVTPENDGSSNTVNISPSRQGSSSITPTNIYVNEQGETVIEVENLDLNTEGGELSLAHLLTQLSQQGIVFDKTKASQMQAHHEVTTASDPESGEVYATGTTYDAAARAPLIIKDEDESTAEDAANTLAQLAVFRGGYNRINQEVITGVPQVSVSTDLQRQYVVESGTNEGYTYAESYTVPSVTNAANAHQFNINDQQDIKVEYKYDYLSTDQSVATDRSTIQSGGILDPQTVAAHGLNEISIGKEIDNVAVESQSEPTTVHIQQNQMQPQVVTYITPASSSSNIQQVQTNQGETETMMIEDFVVEHAGPVQHQYQQPANISVSISADGIVQNAEPHHHQQQHQQSHHISNIPTAFLEAAGQNSYIVINTDDNSTQIICNPDPQGDGNELSGTDMMEHKHHDSVLKNELIENHIIEQQQQLQQIQQEQLQHLQHQAEGHQEHHHLQDQDQHHLQHQEQLQQQQEHQEQYVQSSTVEIRKDLDEMKEETEEFEVHTVTLQEIADSETTESVYVPQNYPSSSMDAVVTTSSNMDNSNNTLQPTQTNNHSSVGDVVIDVHPPVTNDTIISTSPNNSGFATVTVEQHHHQSPPCQDGSTLSSESETSANMPLHYVVSSEGSLKLVTSSSGLMQQQHEQPSQPQ